MAWLSRPCTFSDRVSMGVSSMLGILACVGQMFMERVIAMAMALFILTLTLGITLGKIGL